MIGCRQGDTIFIGTNVVDNNGNPVSLVGANGVFAYSSVADETVTTRNCIINSNNVGYEMTSDETSVLSGEYICEIKLKDVDNKINTVLYETLIVKKSIIPTTTFPV